MSAFKWSGSTSRTSELLTSNRGHNVRGRVRSLHNNKLFYNRLENVKSFHTLQTRTRTHCCDAANCRCCILFTTTTTTLTTITTSRIRVILRDEHSTYNDACKMKSSSDPQRTSTKIVHNNASLIHLSEVTFAHLKLATKNKTRGFHEPNGLSPMSRMSSQATMRRNRQKIIPRTCDPSGFVRRIAIDSFADHLSDALSETQWCSVQNQSLYKPPIVAPIGLSWNGRLSA